MFFYLLATSKTETETDTDTETEMVTLALENIHNTVVKETKPMPLSERVELNSVPGSASWPLQITWT